MENKNEFVNILSLINKGKIKEAEILLSENKKEDGEHFYLTGLIAFFKGNEELALNFFMKAIADENIRPRIKADVKKAASYILFSKGEYKKVREMLKDIKNKNVDDYFVLFASSLLLNEFDDAKYYLNQAYIKDKVKTKALMFKFYNGFVKPSPYLTERDKAYFLNLIERLQVNA